MSVILNLLTNSSPVVLGLVVGLIGALIYFFINYNNNKVDDDDDDDEADDQSKNKSRVITRQEVADHNTLDDLWVVIDNKVYDLTKFVPNHPGGDVIAKNAGGDATKGFYGIQHPERAFFEIEDYFIGSIPDNQRMKYISTEEIKGHNTDNDLWIVVNDRVYDITSFSFRHPGGIDPLIKNSSGRDATAAFFGTQHKKYVHKMINEYFIGYVFNDGDVDFVSTNRKKIANDAKVQLMLESYTLDEIKKHNKDDDAWIIISGKVYDVTKYADDHPGGSVILDNAGGDSTSDFLAAGHPDYVKDLMRDYFVGLVKQ
jgi:cytochrome b involved in lipid metabolism